MDSPRICCPMCSLCVIILSVWGIVQLIAMGVFYHMKVVALLEDLPHSEEEINSDEAINKFIEETEEAYVQNSFNCFVAAGLYLLTLAIAGYQFWVNRHPKKPEKKD